MRVFANAASEEKEQVEVGYSNSKKSLSLGFHLDTLLKPPVVSLSKKVRKARHWFRSSLAERKQLDKLSELEPFGGTIARAFYWAKMNSQPGELTATLRELEAYHDELAQSQNVVDYGLITPGKSLAEREVYRRAASPKIWCRFYFHLVHQLRVNHVLEIGTNLGVSGQYILKALVLNGPEIGPVHFSTMEGIPDLYNRADERFSELTAPENYTIHRGLYEETFPKVCASKQKYSLFFIDGNHRYDATLDYYRTLRQKSTERAIFIFDDINWSPGMQRAWRTIKTSDYVYSIDLFKLGVVVVDQGQTTDEKTDLRLYLTR